VYIYIWKFYINDNYKNEFEYLYGLEGAWVKLFKKDPMYIKTELISDLKYPKQYLTIDYWQTKEAYKLFHFNNKNRYIEIDAVGKKFTNKEEFLGEFFQNSSCTFQ